MPRMRATSKENQSRLGFLHFRLLSMPVRSNSSRKLWFLFYYPDQLKYIVQIGDFLDWCNTIGESPFKSVTIRWSNYRYISDALRKRRLAAPASFCHVYTIYRGKSAYREYLMLRPTCGVCISSLTHRIETGQITGQIATINNTCQPGHDNLVRWK